MKIRRAGVIQNPPADVPVEWQKNAAYLSSDRKRVAWLSDMGEFSRGMRQHSLRVGEAPRAFEATPALAIPGYERARLDCPSMYQPWSHDGRSLLLKFHGKHPILFDVESRRVREFPIGRSWLHIASCSPRLPFAILAPWGYFRRGDTAVFFSIGERLLPGVGLDLRVEYSYAFWRDSGEQLLVLAQDPKRRVSLLRLYDPTDPRPRGEVNVSPALIVPFDEERFKRLKNSDQLMATTEGSPYSTYWGGAREKLDTWAWAHYSAERSTLYLKVFRPAGELKRKHWLWGGFICPATTKWDEIELAFDDA